MSMSLTNILRRKNFGKLLEFTEPRETYPQNKKCSQLHTGISSPCYCSVSNRRSVKALDYLSRRLGKRLAKLNTFGGHSDRLLNPLLRSSALNTSAFCLLSVSVLNFDRAISICQNTVASISLIRVSVLPTVISHFYKYSNITIVI